MKFFPITLCYLIFTALGSSAIQAQTSDTAISSLFPANLEDAEGNPVDASILDGKIVGLFFSAHWCPPCRAFSPILAKFYETHQEEDFEIVFISRDESEREKANYMEEVGMKWPHVPGTRSKDARKAVKKLKVKQFPTLLVFAPDGSLITREGANQVWLGSESAMEKWKEAISANSE